MGHTAPPLAPPAKSDGAQGRAAASCAPGAWARPLALLATLAALLFLDELTLLSSRHLSQLRGILTPRPPRAHCPASASQPLGAWGAFIDPCLLPLLDASGAALRSPFTSHEGNGGADIAQFLYAEPEAGVFFFDAEGPVCMVRAFFAAGFGSLSGDGDNSPNIPTARLKLEVDGAVVLNASIAELFMERAWGGASAFHPRAYAAAAAAEAAAAAAGDPQGALAGLPRTHTFALERRPGGSLHSGWLLQAPVCASRRLRASLIYPGFQHHFWSPALLLQQSVTCTSTYEKCPVAQYVNVNALHFPPGSALPQGWAPFDPRAPPPSLPSAPSGPAAPAAPAPASSSLRHVFSPARVLREARAGADQDVRTTAQLQRGGRSVTIYASPPGGGGGVVTSLTLDFAGGRARRLLHSRRLRVVAAWDVSAEEGAARRREEGARRAREAAAPPAPPGAPEPFTAPGWADAEAGEGWGGSAPGVAAREAREAAARAGARAGGVLEVDLQAHLGPPRMGHEGPRSLMTHQASPRNCRKELYLLGEFPAEGEGGEGSGEGGVYITLPMPFWRSAHIEVQWDDNSAGREAGEAGGEEEEAWEAGEEVALTARVTVARFAAGGGGGGGGGERPHYPPGTAGYLQGSVRSFAVSEGMRGNILAQERGVRGSLALLSVYVVARSQNFVEGDLRVWTDGSPSPSVWESGWEDYFNGSHGYDEDPHHCGEALFAYDRVDPLGWGCYNNSDTTVHLYQLRLLMGDAVRFAEGFRVAVEGLPGGKSAGRVRAAALWYALPAPPLLSTDWVHPPALWGAGGGAEHVVLAGQEATLSHPALAGSGSGSGSSGAGAGGARYTVLSASDGVAVYNLVSGLPSYGEWRRVALLKCFSKGWCHHEGVEGGVAVSVAGALAVGAGGWVAFTLRVLPACAAVLLRRLVDLRYAPQAAALYIDGVRAGTLGSSDRDTPHMHTSWKVDTLALPSALTAGKAALRIALHVLGEGGGERSYADTTVIDRQAGGGHWSEVRWEAVCVQPLPAVAL